MLNSPVVGATGCVLQCWGAGCAWLCGTDLWQLSQQSAAPLPPYTAYQLLLHYIMLQVTLYYVLCC